MTFYKYKKKNLLQCIKKTTYEKFIYKQVFY